MRITGKAKHEKKIKRSPPKGRHDTETGSGISGHDRKSIPTDRKRREARNN